MKKQRQISYGNIIEELLRRNDVLENKIIRVSDEDEYGFFFDASSQDQELKIGVRIRGGHVQLDYLHPDLVEKSASSLDIINRINGETRVGTYTIDEDGYLWARCDGFLCGKTEEVEVQFVKMMMVFQAFLLSTLPEIVCVFSCET